MTTSYLSVPSHGQRRLLSSGNQFLKMAEKPETRKWLTESYYDPWVIGPAEAQAQMLKDIKKWAEWVKLANLEPKG